MLHADFRKLCLVSDMDVLVHLRSRSMASHSCHYTWLSRLPEKADLQESGILIRLDLRYDSTCWTSSWSSSRTVSLGQAEGPDRSCLVTGLPEIDSSMVMKDSMTDAALLKRSLTIRHEVDQALSNSAKFAEDIQYMHQHVEACQLFSSHYPGCHRPPFGGCAVESYGIAPDHGVASHASSHLGCT